MLLEIPKIETILFDGGSARVKFDEFNQRIKIVSLQGDLDKLMHKLSRLYNESQVGKVFCVIPEEQIDLFKAHDFIMEAKIDYFLKGEPGYFLSRFITLERKVSLFIPEEEEVLIKSRSYQQEYYTSPNYQGYLIRDAQIGDAKTLAKLYGSVFETYPSPMNNEAYIRFVMEQDVFFKVAVYKDQIVSAASADMDPIQLNVEMTDCATYKEHRGKGLMGRLLFELEKEMKERDYRVLYSTARSISTGMNIIFNKHDYEYGGRLVNHCHICGQFENMNIWVKTL